MLGDKNLSELPALKNLDLKSILPENMNISDILNAVNTFSSFAAPASRRAESGADAVDAAPAPYLENRGREHYIRAQSIFFGVKLFCKTAKQSLHVGIAFGGKIQPKTRNHGDQRPFGVSTTDILRSTGSGTERKSAHKR